ncbi:MAG: ABC transporter ATP-binding protein [Desulfomonile tiedjei]|nr:ABC transporter ATP-binding protein [Desulfomonile tiedjei]
MTEPLLTTKGLSVIFGGLSALTGLDLSIRKREILALIGPNGAGKTTAFNAITGSVKPSAGSVIFRGKDITGWSPPRVARFGIARTFQQIRLYSDLTVIENVMVAGHSSIRYSFVEAIAGVGRFTTDERRIREQAEHLLEVTGLIDVAKEKAQFLPYGNQRKLEMARALALDPLLLLLDEPVAGMNPIETIEFGELLGRLRQELNLTTCLIEHDMGFVMDICEKLKVLDHGLPIAFGTPDEIRSDRRVIAAYLGEG